VKKENKDIWIGAAAVGVFSLLVAFMDLGVSAVTEVSASTTRVVGKFNKVDGLTEGSDVRLGGIKVGRVTSMKLDDQFRAVITMDIDGAYNFPSDTSASIHTDGLFGGKFVVLEPGAEEEPLKTGDEFVLTQDAMIVSDLLDLIISEGKVARAKSAKSKDQ
jgi:phospholipid/cholesterol/gamma-HCH transport system substrate-binding protein